MGEAYQAFDAWCGASGVQNPTTHREVYGPHSDDPEQPSLTTSWLRDQRNEEH